jgi:RNA polymerase sigma factor (sigma-70 family)
VTQARSLILVGEALVPQSARTEERPDPSAALSTPTAHDMTVAIARGDAAVFEVLYRAWFPRLLGLAGRATGRDESFALDVVQDAFIRVIRSPRVCPTEGELAAWLRTCVLSAAVDRLRSEARRSTRERQTHACAPPTPEGPNESVEAAERLAWLARRLAELGPLDQELIRLRFDIERSLRQIAAESDGRTWAGVHGRVRRLVERLKIAASEYFA